MNTPIIRKIDLGIVFQPLASERTVGTFTFRASGNAVVLMGDDGTTEIPIVKNQEFTLSGVDLADLQAKGTIGDHFVVLGATRTV